MDPAIFTGVVSVDRVRSERPAEYQRLESSGKLPGLYVQPPSKGRLLFAYSFGLACAIAGVLLITAILWSVIAY